MYVPKYLCTCGARLGAACGLCSWGFMCRPPGAAAAARLSRRGRSRRMTRVAGGAWATRMPGMSCHARLLLHAHAPGKQQQQRAPAPPRAPPRWSPSLQRLRHPPPKPPHPPGPSRTAPPPPPPPTHTHTNAPPPWSSRSPDVSRAARASVLSPAPPSVAPKARTTSASAIGRPEAGSKGRAVWTVEVAPDVSLRARGCFESGWARVCALVRLCRRVRACLNACARACRQRVPHLNVSVMGCPSSPATAARTARRRRSDAARPSYDALSRASSAASLVRHTRWPACGVCMRVCSLLLVQANRPSPHHLQGRQRTHKHTHTHTHTRTHTHTHARTLTLRASTCPGPNTTVTSRPAELLPSVPASGMATPSRGRPCSIKSYTDPPASE